jgi:hypothetical protein
VRGLILIILLIFQFGESHAQWYLSLSGKKYINKESQHLDLPENGYQQGRFSEGFAQITGYKADFDSAIIDTNGRIVLSGSGIITYFHYGDGLFLMRNHTTKEKKYFKYDNGQSRELTTQERKNLLTRDQVIRNDDFDYYLTFAESDEKIDLMIHEEPDDDYFVGYGPWEEIVRIVRAKSEPIFEVGYVNYKNELIFPFVAGAGTDFENGMAVVSERYTKRMYIIGKDGNRIEKYPESKLITPFQQGLSLVEQNGLFGYMNLDGEWEIEPQYDFGSPFLDGYAAVTFNEKDSIQRFYSADNFSSLFNGQYSMGMYRIIDQEGNYVSDNWYAGLPKILPSGAAHVTILSEDGTRQYEALIDLENGGQIFDKGREKAARDYLSPY